MLHSSIPCVIFAGGKSSRMKTDKSLLPFEKSQNMTEYQYQRLKKIFERVYISTKDKNKFVELKHVPFIEDIHFSGVYAPTIGLFNIFEHLQDDEAVFVLSVDTPFVSIELIEALLSIDISQYDAVIAKTSEGIHPLCGVYKPSLKANLLKMIESQDHKLGHLLKQSMVCYFEVEDEDLLMNLNTPQQYQKALDRL